MTDLKATTDTDNYYATACNSVNTDGDIVIVCLEAHRCMANLYQCRQQTVKSCWFADTNRQTRPTSPALQASAT